MTQSGARSIAIAFVLASSCACEESTVDERPNFVLFLADDQGWTGTSVAMFPGQPFSRSDFYQTPNLEELARGGMRFSNGYAPSPNCSPSRISILTGKSPAQLGLTDLLARQQKGESRFYSGNKLNPPVGSPGLSEDEITIAEALKELDSSYATAHFGKWHVDDLGPGFHGFDFHDGATINADAKGSSQDPKNIIGISDRATAFMEEQVAEGRPFYLQLSHYAVHLKGGADKLPAREETIRKYEARKRGVRHSNARLAAQTEHLDDGLGMILAKLDELGITGNTYVIYTSDNGGGAHTGITNNLPLAQGKTHLFEGGIRVPMLFRGPGIAGGGSSDVPVIGWDLFPTILDLAGGDSSLPAGVEGGSLRPLLEGREQQGVSRPRTGLFWHFPHYNHSKGMTPQSAIRLGDFKLIRFHETGEARLFNLRDDIGETIDLATGKVKLVRDLNVRLDEYLLEIGARMPVANAGYDGSHDPAMTY